MQIKMQVKLGHTVSSKTRKTRWPSYKTVTFRHESMFVRYKTCFLEEKSVSLFLLKFCWYCTCTYSSAGILVCHSRKGTAAANNINDGFITAITAAQQLILLLLIPFSGRSKCCERRLLIWTFLFQIPEKDSLDGIQPQ